jgi:peptidoglycan/LPS O-acetylase OafA/YrhL
MTQDSVIDDSAVATSPVIEFTPDEHPRERRASLDGVRAFAVAAVIAFHGGLPRAHGGFLGVDVFFVLSGFLITSLLVSEYDARRKISLPRFYVRRAKRLLPALALVSMAIIVMANLITPPGYYETLRQDAVAALFYFSNWHLMATGHSYFTVLAPPTPFTHTWSLAIEEQFYIVWPLVLLAIFRWRRSLVVVGTLAAAAALGSSLLMVYGAHEHWPINRLYYGTDTHAMGLLFGAATSCVLYEAIRPGVPGRWLTQIRSVLKVGGPIGAAVVVLVMFLAYGASRWLFYVGFFAVSVGASVFVAYLVVLPRSGPARLLALAPIVYIGQISYGLYLWHFPIFQWLTSYWTGLDPPALFVVRLACTVAAAVISFHLVEMPIRRREWPLTARTAGIFLVVAVLVVSFCVVGAERANTLPPIEAAPAPLPSTPATTLVLGDSVAFTLAFTLAPSAPHYGLRILNGTIIGCGLVASTAAQEHAQVRHRPKRCELGPHESSLLPQWWSQQISTKHPRLVVLLAGRWEERNLLIGRRWYSIDSPRIQRLMSSSVQAISADASAAGARLVVLNMPCAWDGERQSGAPWIENTPARQNTYNAQLRRDASAVGAAYFNIDSMVCPTGKLQYFFGGTMVRKADGVHFAIGSAPFVAPRLLPFLAAQARLAP